MELNWNFQRGGEVLRKSLPWGTYGYFLELHNVFHIWSQSVRVCNNEMLSYHAHDVGKNILA